MTPAARLIIILAVVLAALMASLAKKPAGTGCHEAYQLDKSIVIKDETIRAEVADSSSERQKGLSGRKCMQNNQAMLFSYDTAGKQCFWMKDMHFALDIVWLDSDKRIVYIAPNVSPDTYPSQLCPDKSAQYVLELVAGSSARLGVGTYTRIEF